MKASLALLVLTVAGLAMAQSPQPDSFNPGAVGVTVGSMAVQADGTILVGGEFTALGGQTRNRIGRLSPDGALDTLFNPQANANVYSLAVQTDGKILVGGDFTTLGGSARTALGRLNSTGSLDTTFNPTIFESSPFFSITARAQVILVQPDGKILVAGRSTLTPTGGPPGPTEGYVRRLNANGTSDSGFTTVSPNGPVAALALQPDGKILVGGLFTSMGSVRNRIARLNSNGTLDTSFNPGADAGVLALAVQPDGKILVGGSFSTLAGQPRSKLGRLHPDGSVDSFNPDVVAFSYVPAVYSLALQADGRIVVSGWFSYLRGVSRSNLGRLNADGTLDTGFNAGANNFVYALALQADGKLLVGGDFTTLGGQPRSKIGRLNSTAPATQCLTDDGATITWRRGGSGPEFWRTTFELSTDLLTWSPLGDGTRVDDGWELTGLALPLNAKLRARGYVTGGGFTASSWFVEKTLLTLPPPTIVTDDGNFGVQANQFGFNLRARPGQAVVIEACTALTNWTPLVTNTLVSTPCYFSDPGSASLPARFYRARSD